LVGSFLQIRKNSFSILQAGQALMCRSSSSALVAEIRPTPDEILQLEDPSYGRVRLELWSKLTLRVKKQSVEISVLRSQIHLEKAQPPAPLLALTF
jgi:hypothetical protein